MHTQCRAPRATYRLQLNKDFTFADAGRLAPYLQALGVSHAYLSPVLTARPGSTHGYDTTDHLTLNPELGSMDDFRAMAAALRAAGLAILLDIVPNHMGVGGDRNALWLDLLEWGRASRYADWFDINWNPADQTLRDRILVPFLGCSYGEALRDGRLALRLDPDAGEFAIWAEDAHKLPVNPASYGALFAEMPGLDALAKAFAATGPDDAPARKAEFATLLQQQGTIVAALQSRVDHINSQAGQQQLADLIARQHWRVARASVAADDINYRRFFIVSDLAAVRVERDEVFDHVHRLIFELVAEGLVDGLRIDHIDGLFDPKAYCETLRKKCPRPVYLVVEKILAPHETLRTDWGVDGTTGYEFSGALTRLLTDATSEEKLSRLYEDFTGRHESFDAVEAAAKHDIMEFEMAAELDALATRLRSIAVTDRLTADLTRNALRAGLRAVIAALPVYRTYIDDAPADKTDRRTIAFAIAKALKAAPSLDPAIWDFLEQVMTGTRGPASIELAKRIQQYSGPVMAKGLEDTALYRFNRLIALSDVGEKPDRFSQSITAFHDFMTSRRQYQPHGMLSTSSHDTKRGEDVRARIAAISGYPDAWAEAVRHWTEALAAAGAPKIEANDAYYFFQLLVGAWPMAFGPTVALTDAQLAPFCDRITAAMLKSVREARLRTNWAVPRTDYEQSLSRYIAVALSATPDNRFLAAFRQFEALIARDGADNGLISTVIKLTTPGVPDLYQGAELWEQSMVDPDNRRKVDFAHRQALLASLTDGDISGLTDDFRSGTIKLALIERLLACRAMHHGLFENGSYEPVPVEGPDAHRVLCFIRRDGEQALLVAIALGSWRGKPDATITPAAFPPQARDLLRHRSVNTSTVVSDLLADGLPVAVLQV